MRLVIDRKIIMLLVLAVLAAIKFAYLPLIDLMSERRAEVKRLKERVARIDRARIEVEQLQAQTAQLDSALSDVRSQFETVSSSEAVQFSFQKSLEEKAKRVDVLLESTEWGEAVEGTPSSSVIKISLSGQLRDVMRFHHDIASLGYNVMTSELEMTTVRQLLSRSRLGNAKAKLSLRIFYLLEEG